MPHSARTQSETGFYHVVVKGDGGQLLFECDHHKNRYLRFLVSAAKVFSVEVHGYCLMSNHVHFLVRDAKRELSQFMKTLNEAYAMYYAHVSGRIGHVYQGRFWSEPIQTESHYLCALRYIHANPEASGICLTQDYPWSSYSAYVYGSKFVKTELALTLLGGVQAFQEFSSFSHATAAPFSMSRLRNHLTTDELVRIAECQLGSGVLASAKNMGKERRDEVLRKMGDAQFSIAQISRLTGIGRNIVRSALGR